MKKPRFTKIKDGEWFRPKMRGHLMKCCDCNLVHRMNFRIQEGRVEIQAWRKQ
jgi:hypothetical protein